MNFELLRWLEKLFPAKLKFVNDERFNSKLNMTFRALPISFYFSSCPSRNTRETPTEIIADETL